MFQCHICIAICLMYIEAIQYVVSKNGRTFHNEQSTDYSVLFMGRDRSCTGSTRITDLNKNGIN